MYIHTVCLFLFFFPDICFVLTLLEGNCLKYARAMLDIGDLIFFEYLVSNNKKKSVEWVRKLIIYRSLIFFCFFFVVPYFVSVLSFYFEEKKLDLLLLQKLSLFSLLLMQNLFCFVAAICSVHFKKMRVFFCSAWRAGKQTQEI